MNRVGARDLDCTEILGLINRMAIVDAQHLHYGNSWHTRLSPNQKMG